MSASAQNMHEEKAVSRVLYKKPLVWFMYGVGYMMAWLLSHPFKWMPLQRPALRHEDVSFPSELDGVMLKGWWLEADEPGEKAVIFAHGYMGHRNDKQFIRVAEELVNDGYHVLMFDFRGCCQSEGRMTTVGILEQYDLLGAIKYVKHEKKMKHIAIIGWSMGAATTILAAHQSKDVKAVICDSPFDDLESYLHDNLSKWTRLPKVFSPFVFQALQSMVKLDIKSSSPIEKVADMTNPILFIHSEDDKLIPHSHSKRLYEAANAKKEIWLSSGARHIESHLQHGKQYTEKVLAFLREHMPG